MRDSIMNIIESSAESAAQDAAQIAQTAAATVSVLQGKCEPDTLDKGANVVEKMVSGAKSTGLNEGTADLLAAGIGGVFDQGEGQLDDAGAATDGQSAAAGRRLQASGGSATDGADAGSNATGTGVDAEAARRKAAARAAKLVNVTDGLSALLGSSLLLGEVPTQVRSPSLTASIFPNVNLTPRPSGVARRSLAPICTAGGPGPRAASGGRVINPPASRSAPSVPSSVRCDPASVAFSRPTEPREPPTAPGPPGAVWRSRSAVYVAGDCASHTSSGRGVIEPPSSRGDVLLSSASSRDSTAPVLKCRRCVFVPLE